MVIVRCVVTVLITVILLLLAACSRAPAQALDFARTPIIFVHGSGMSSRVWKSMVKELAAEGYPRSYLLAIDLVPKSGSNLSAAEEQIAPAVERLLRQAAAEADRAGLRISKTKVDIVAHSMGAASTRWYTAKVAPQRVRTWISIAGSNHGSDALRGFDFPGDLEMVPAFAGSSDESAFQVALNGTPDAPRDETPYGLGEDAAAGIRIAPDTDRKVLYFTIFIDPDFYIKPEKSAMLDGAGGVEVAIPDGVDAVQTSPGNFRMLGQRDHDSLPGNQDVIKLVSSLLNLGAR